jgi:hypothetical protein
VIFGLLRATSGCFVDFGYYFLPGDHGFGLHARFGGPDPKEKFDMEGFFPTYFPKLDVAPKTRDPKSANYQKSMFYLTLKEAKDCFDEWNERVLATTEIQDNLGTKQVMTIVGLDPMLMDLVERGMGPAYWEVHESFLIHWIMGLAIRQACGFSTRWAHEGGQRYIPQAAVPSVEAAMAASEARLLYLRPWRSTSPLFTETLAPRCASENLPGHVWVTGLGYLPTGVVRDIKQYLVAGGDNHPDFKGVPRDVVVTMINWCNDIVSRVNARRFISDPMNPELGNHFVDFWNKAVSKKALGADGISRSVCSPLFCETGSVAVLFGMKRGLLFHQASMLHLESETRTRWDFPEGFPKLRESLVKFPISVHMPSMYGATSYLQFFENRRPLNGGRPYRGVKFPENLLLPEDKVPFPSEVEDQPFRRRFKTALTKGKNYF